jgi:glycosyltransferase involved in cell wall biosynthesis
MEQKKRVILFYNDNPKMSSGCAQIWDSLLPRFVKYRPEWKYLCVGWQNHDRPHETKEGYIMLPCDPRTPYSFDNVLENINSYKPDFFITTADIGTQLGFSAAVSEAKKQGWKGKWIAYSYLDTSSWEKLFWDKILDLPDINLVMADFGFKIFKQHNVPNLEIIKAGVDTKIYKPLEDNKLRVNNGLNDKFVIGFIGRNQRRKMLANLLKGFAQFSKGKSDVLLLLHTEENAGDGWDLNCVIEKFTEYDPELRILKKVRLTKDHFNHPIRQLIQPSSMNEIYNLMDYECHAVGGEGFGLPCLEAESAGVPLIMTDCSTAPELTNQGKMGVLIPVLKDQYGRLMQEIGPNGVENVIPNDVELSKIFEELYVDWKNGGVKLKERKEQSRKFAENYEWDKRVPEWFQLFDKYLE